MDEHDDDLESIVEEDAAIEVDEFPEPDEDNETTQPDRAAADDESDDDDPAEL